MQHEFIVIARFGLAGEIGMLQDLDKAYILKKYTRCANISQFDGCYRLIYNYNVIIAMKWAATYIRD